MTRKYNAQQWAFNPDDRFHQDFKRTYEKIASSTAKDGGGNIGSESIHSSPEKTLENKCCNRLGDCQCKSSSEEVEISVEEPEEKTAGVSYRDIFES